MQACDKLRTSNAFLPQSLLLLLLLLFCVAVCLGTFLSQLCTVFSLCGDMTTDVCAQLPPQFSNDRTEVCLGA